MPEEKTKKQNPDISRRQKNLLGRFGIILALCGVLGLCIIFFMTKTTTVDAADWEAMSATTLRDSAEITPRRGDILASNGAILATNLTYCDVRIDFRADHFATDSFVYYLPSLADSLSELFPSRTAAEWREHLERGISVPKARRSRGWSIARRIPREQAERVRAFPFFSISKNSSRTGLVINDVTVRAYPFGEMARMSVGRVGMTAENPRVLGRWGLECSLDPLLYGTPGLKRKALSTSGYYMAVEQPAIDGAHVTTTIDITIQDLLEHELAEMLRLSTAEWGAAMIMEVATGDIKAISNLERDSITHEIKPALNRLVDYYEPGSVMKVMSMAVDLRKGYVNVNQTYSIGRSYAYLGRKPIKDTHSPATLTPDQFLCYSSNIGMVKLNMPHYEHNPELFRTHLQEIGFFDTLRTGMDREKTPHMRHLEPNTQGRLDLSRMVFGYSFSIPPLYTCAFYNAVANDGRFVRPRLVKGLRFPDGRDSVIPVTYVRDRILEPGQAALLRRMMRDVVWETGGTARCLMNPTVEIAGKTGTCIIALEDRRPRVNANGDSIALPPFKGGYRQGHNRVTFCGFFPYENPRYTCIVIMNDPRGQYRGPAVSSGTVLMNLALKMHARGMLEPDPQFAGSAPAGTSAALLHSSLQPDRNSTLAAELGITGAHTIRQPNSDYPSGTVPDVRGISIREAISRLEGAGYAVALDGTGYVFSQSPEPGTAASPGTRVSLRLQNSN